MAENKVEVKVEVKEEEKEEEETKEEKEEEEKKEESAEETAEEEEEETQEPTEAKPKKEKKKRTKGPEVSRTNRLLANVLNIYIYASLDDVFPPPEKVFWLQTYSNLLKTKKQMEGDKKSRFSICSDVRAFLESIVITGVGELAVAIKSNKFECNSQICEFAKANSETPNLSAMLAIKEQTIGKIGETLEGAVDKNRISIHLNELMGGTGSVGCNFISQLVIDFVKCIAFLLSVQVKLDMRLLAMKHLRHYSLCVCNESLSQLIMKELSVQQKKPKKAGKKVVAKTNK
jgi:hypothetical protein